MKKLTECFLAIDANSGRSVEIKDGGASRLKELSLDAVAKALDNPIFDEKTEGNQHTACAFLFDKLTKSEPCSLLAIDAKIEIVDGKKLILAHIRQNDSEECKENENRLEVIEGHLIDIVERESTKKTDKDKIFAGIFETISAGVAIIDDKGLIVDINKRLISIFELGNKEDIVGSHFSKHLFAIQDGEVEFLCDPGCVISDKKKFVGCASNASQREFEYVTKSGRKVFTLISVACFKNHESKTNFIYSITDVTALKEIEKKQKEGEKLLLARSRMADMGEMIGAIAHQWRQPLNTLGLLVQDVPYCFKNRELTSEYVKDFNKNAMEQITFMSKTIDDFRNFFKTDKQIVPFSIVEYVKNTIFLVYDMYRARGIEIVVKQTASPMVKGFPNEFSQALLNILSNAKDALEESSAKRKKIEVGITEDGSHGIVHICDNGGGIKDSVINRIFEPYFTTKSEGKGTGIGLYMSKIIIEENIKGSLTVKNGEEGAIFTIKIPL